MPFLPLLQDVSNGKNFFRLDEVVLQKIDYIHRNPVQPKWQLAATPEDYSWSSAAFYLSANLSWPFLTHFWYGEDWPPPM